MSDDNEILCGRVFFIGMKVMNRYLQQDYLGAQIARMYSNEVGEPFFAAVGNYGDCDVQSVSGIIKIEIKTESTPIRTHNVAIEFWNIDLDMPSGVLGTKASLWLHIILTTEGWIAIEYDVDRLRKLVIEQGQIKSNGKNSIFKLIPVDEFKKHAKRVYPFESKFLNNTIVQQEGNLGHGEIPESGNVPCLNLSDVV